MIQCTISAIYARIEKHRKKIIGKGHRFCMCDLIQFHFRHTYGRERFGNVFIFRLRPLRFKTLPLARIEKQSIFPSTPHVSKR